MKAVNQMKLIFESHSVNESFSRVAVASFCAQLDMTVEELGDIKTIVSEAVTNCIVHAYRETIGRIFINVSVYENGLIKITVRDKGCGMEDVEKAREPLYSSLGGDRAGLGFSVMESFSDKLCVRSKRGEGTTVTLYKYINGKKYE